MLGRIVFQSLALTAMWRELREARDEGDKLKMFDAILRALAIASAIAVIAREARQQGSLKRALDLED